MQVAIAAKIIHLFFFLKKLLVTIFVSSLLSLSLSRSASVLSVRRNKDPQSFDVFGCVQEWAGMEPG